MATDLSGRRAQDGKAGRPRNGQARTRLARAAVVQAARALFLERGYAVTTIEAISGTSDVPPATVYRLFSSKLGILKAVLDVSIAGDGQAAPLQDRASVRALLADTDPIRQLSGFAGICRQINARSAPIYRILLSAAGSDPGAAALLADYTRQRQAGPRADRPVPGPFWRAAAGAETARRRRHHPRAHVSRGLPAARR